MSATTVKVICDMCMVSFKIVLSYYLGNIRRVLFQPLIVEGRIGFRKQLVLHCIVMI